MPAMPVVEPAPCRGSGPLGRAAGGRPGSASGCRRPGAHAHRAAQPGAGAGGAAAAGRAAGCRAARGLVEPAKVRLPACEIKESPTRYGKVQPLEEDAARHQPQAQAELQAVGPGVGVARRHHGQRQGPQDHDRGPQGPGQGSPQGRQAAGGALGLPLLRLPEALFDSYVRTHGYAQAIKFSARPGHSEHQLGTTIDFTTAPGVPPDHEVRRLAGRQVAGPKRLEVRLHHVLPQGQEVGLLLRLRAVALALLRPRPRTQDPRERPGPAALPVRELRDRALDSRVAHQALLARSRRTIASDRVSPCPYGPRIRLHRGLRWPRPRPIGRPCAAMRRCRDDCHHRRQRQRRSRRSCCGPSTSSRSRSRRGASSTPEPASGSGSSPARRARSRRRSTMRARCTATPASPGPWPCTSPGTRSTTTPACSST